MSADQNRADEAQQAQQAQQAPQAPQRRDPADPVVSDDRDAGGDARDVTGLEDRDHAELARDPLAKADTTYEASRGVEPSG